MKNGYRLLPGRPMLPVQGLVITLLAILVVLPVSAQRGFNYYKDPAKVGSPNEKAYTYFKKAYYDHIWQWSKAGADSAEYYLKLAIQEDPNYAAAYAFLAHVYQFKTYDNVDFDKKLALQKQYAEKALSFNPQTGDAYSAMSDVKWHEKDTAQALGLLRKAIAMEPDHVGNYIWIGIRFNQAGMPDSAIDYLHRLVVLDPEYGQAYMKLGTVYASLNKADSAKYYFRKAIHHYNTIVPRDKRMMGGYYALTEVWEKEQQYDSAVSYYTIFRRELEASDMYIKEMFLNKTYKGLFACYDRLSGQVLKEYVDHSELSIAANPQDLLFGLGVLEDMMTIDRDSVLEKHALPIARRLQSVKTDNRNYHIFSILDEYATLKKLKHNKEAIAVLEALYAKEPNEPYTLFEMGRVSILGNKQKQGLEYLRKSKAHLNEWFVKKDFLAELSNRDFDKVRNTLEFKKLSE